MEEISEQIEVPYFTQTHCDSHTLLQTKLQINVDIVQEQIGPKTLRAAHI